MMHASAYTLTQARIQRHSQNFGTSHTHFPYAKRFLTQHKSVYLQKTNQIKPVSLSQIDHFARAYTYLRNVIASYFSQNFCWSNFQVLEKSDELVNSLLALVPTLAEPPEITHLLRRLSSTDTKHPESGLHRAGFVGHTPRESSKDPYFSPRIQ